MATDQVSAPQASWSWGPILAARHLFEELALGPILDGKHPRLRHGQPLSERVFPLVANRLTRPGSEHALAQWLEDFYVCNREGSRRLPLLSLEPDLIFYDLTSAYFEREGPQDLARFGYSRDGKPGVPSGPDRSLSGW